MCGVRSACFLRKAKSFGVVERRPNFVFHSGRHNSRSSFIGLPFLVSIYSAHLRLVLGACLYRHLSEGISSCYIHFSVATLKSKMSGNDRQNLKWLYEALKLVIQQSLSTMTYTKTVSRHVCLCKSILGLAKGLFFFAVILYMLNERSRLQYCLAVVYIVKE